MNMARILSGLNLLFLLALTANARKRDLYLLGLYSITGVWTGGPGTRTSVDMALEQINANEDILPDYILKVLWSDDGCDAATGMNQMYKQLYEEPTKLMVFGAACSGVTEVTAIATHQWNLVQFSYLSGSSALADKHRYPMYFHIGSPHHLRNPASVEMMKFYKWKRVATIHQSLEVFSKGTEDLAKKLEENNITLITSEIFTNDPTQQVQNLKRHKARIIVLGCEEHYIHEVMCEAYKNGMYGAKYVWFIPAYFADYWWKMEPEGTDCTPEQITLVAEGVIAVGRVFLDRKNRRGLAGYTPSEWEVEYHKRMEGLSLRFADRGPLAFDSAWAVALVLNFTEQDLKDKGSNKTLADFTYDDSEIANLIASNVIRVRFQGLKGWVQFDDLGNGLDNLRLRRVQNGERQIVGYYDALDKTVEWVPEAPIIWQGGKPPRDSTQLIEKRIFVGLNIYITMSLLAGAGIILSTFFFIFNIVYRKKRLIKMSSPKMNNIIVLGCVVAYTTVFLQERSDTQVSILCKVRPYVIMIGFSLAFGALFAKTWRVYAIFMNQTKKVIIKDEKLILVVLAIVGIDVIIAIVRETSDPMNAVINTMGTTELEGGDIVIANSNWICTSKYDVYFKGVIFGIKGLLLIFGAFLALQTRKVKIPALNDSQYIGMCIYNIAVMSLLGVVLIFALTEQVDLGYILASGTIILGTTTTQLIIFIPKISRFATTSEVEDLSIMSEMSQRTGTMNSTQGVNVIKIRSELDLKNKRIEEMEKELQLYKSKNQKLPEISEVN